MAFIDYGAIVFKNGKLVTKEMFDDMKEPVGWEDWNSNEVMKDIDENPLHLKNNYFAYIGDEEVTICFYKTNICIVEKIGDKFHKHIEYLSNQYTWSKWRDWVGSSDCVVTKRNGYYICKWKYKNDNYKVYFGYGVDIGAYKKWHIVNYYRSIYHYWRKMKYWLKSKIH